MENKDIAFTIMDGSGADVNIEIARPTARLYASRFFFFFFFYAFHGVAWDRVIRSRDDAESSRVKAIVRERKLTTSVRVNFPNSLEACIARHTC